MMNYIILDKFHLDPDETPDLFITDMNNKAKYILAEVRLLYKYADIRTRGEINDDGDVEVWRNDEDYKYCITDSWEIIREIEKICVKYDYILAEDSY